MKPTPPDGICCSKASRSITTGSPKITVILPTFNCAETIFATLDALIDQHILIQPARRPHGPGRKREERRARIALIDQLAALTPVTFNEPSMRGLSNSLTTKWQISIKANTKEPSSQFPRVRGSGRGGHRPHFGRTRSFESVVDDQRLMLSQFQRENGNNRPASGRNLKSR